MQVQNFSMSNKLRRNDPVLICCVWVTLSALIAMRAWFHFTASPLPDEAYYWLWGQRPGLSYFDHPPLQAWLQAVTQSVFGTSRFALRLPAVFTTSILIACLFWWHRRLGQPHFPTTLAVTFSSPLIFTMTGMVFNDHLMIACLALATIQLFLLYDNPCRIRHLYAAALLIGLAGLAKYNAAVFAIGAFAVIPLTPKLRKLLLNPHLYAAAAVCLLCLMPVFIWNFANDAASFKYNLEDRLGVAPTWPKAAGRAIVFLVAFCFVLSPVAFVAIVAALRKPNQQTGLRTALIVFSFATLFCVLLSYSTFVIYYWNVIAVVALLPFLPLLMKRWAILSHMLYGTGIIAVLLVNHIVRPFAAPADNETAIMYGWPEINMAISRYQADWLITTDYRSAAILAFWQDDPSVDVIAERISQFTLWFDNPAREGMDAIILSSDWFPLTDVVFDRFERVEALVRVPVTKWGRPITTYKIWLGIGYSSPE